VSSGAGISVSEPANIPDFRSATGLFRKLKEKHPTAGLSSGKDLFDARLFGVSRAVPARLPVR
jgi:NAD-dependent SIR2 family protein deacetylase